MSRLSPTSFYRLLDRIDFAARRLGLIALLGSGAFVLWRLCTSDQLLSAFSILMLSFAAVAVTKPLRGWNSRGLFAAAVLCFLTIGQTAVASRAFATTPIKADSYIHIPKHIYHRAKVM